MTDNVKWSINNRCNLSCPYCFADSYFKENTFGEKCKIIDKLYSIGVTNIDFFGREPLFDDTMFRLINYMETTEQLFNLSFITNGKNLLRYKKDIINCFYITQFAVSYDFMVSRKFNIDPTMLREFEDNGIMVEVTIDLQRYNKDKIYGFIESRYVEYVTLNPIIPMGNNDLGAKNVMISLQELLEIIDNLQTLVTDKTSKVYVNVPYRMSTGFDTSKFYNKNVVINFEPVCTCGIDHAFISSDGFIYGCNSAAYNHSNKCCNFLQTDVEEIEKIIKCEKGKRECLRS